MPPLLSIAAAAELLRKQELTPVGLLDQCLARIDLLDPEVRAWAAAQPAGRLFLSAITMLELEKGVLALERRTPPHGSALRSWLTGVSAAFSGRILPFTELTAKTEDGVIRLKRVTPSSF